MAKDGDYPFFVNVWNRFEKGSNVKLEVVFYHYYNGADPGEDPPPPGSSNSYTIHSGDMVAFPLYWAITDESGNYNGEYLEVKFVESTRPTTEIYYVWLGPKANYNEDLSHILGVKFISSGSGGYSGLYEFPENTDMGTIKVQKRMLDPESDSVSVGPDIP